MVDLGGFATQGNAAAHRVAGGTGAQIPWILTFGEKTIQVQVFCFFCQWFFVVPVVKLVFLALLGIDYPNLYDVVCGSVYKQLAGTIT